MAFETVTQEEFEAATTAPSQGFEPISSELRGSLGIEVPTEVAADLSAGRQAARESASTGFFPEQNQIIGAISRGLLEGSTAGLGQAGLETAISDDRFDPASPQFTNPYSFGVSEIVGNFAPVGKLIKAALEGKALLTGAMQGGKAVVKAAPSLIKTGAATGTVYGGAGGEAEALRKDKDVVDSIKSVLSGAGTGLVVGGATGGLIKKGQAARMDPSEAFLAFTKTRVGSKAQTQAVHFLDSGKLEQSVGSVKNFFKIPKNITTEQATQLAKQTGEKLFSQVNDIAAQFPKHRLDGSRLQEGLQREVLDDPLLKVLSPGTQREFTDAAAQISSDRTLKEAIALQKNLNAKARARIKSVNAGGDPKLNDEIQFLDVLRRENSKLIDDAITGLTGLDDNPYRRWGSVNELQDILDARFGNLRNLGAQLKEAGVKGKLKKFKNLDFTGDEMKSADALISNLFNKIPEYEVAALPTRVAAQRMSRSIAPPPVIPTGTGPIAPAPSLSQIISQLSGVGRAIPESPPGGPLLGVTPVGPAPSIATPGFAPPSSQDIGAIIQQLLQEQNAQRAVEQAASTVGVF